MSGLDRFAPFIADQIKRKDYAGSARLGRGMPVDWTRRGALAALACLPAGCSAEKGSILRASDHHPTGYPTVAAVEFLGAQLREATDGDFSIKTYPGGQLGSERDTIELTIFGGVDINRINAAPLNTLAPETIVPCLPFLFRDEMHMRSALDGAPGDTILDAMEPYGLIGLCFYDSGARSFYNTKRPIQSLDDMRGMKVRVQNSDLYVSMIKALGADATPMYLGEVYQSLVQGVIDAAENNWPSYFTGRHFEVAQYYSLSRHVMAPEVLVMSARTWGRLPQDVQQIVRSAARTSVTHMRALWDARVSQSRAAIEAAGVEINEIEDIESFSNAMRPIWQRYASDPKLQRLIEDIANV